MSHKKHLDTELKFCGEVVLDYNYWATSLTHKDTWLRQPYKDYFIQNRKTSQPRNENWIQFGNDMGSLGCHFRLLGLRLECRFLFLPGKQREQMVSSYLFSQETPSISMLWERERDWDCVSRLLDGELLRELTPSLLWLRWATPTHERWDRERPTWHNASPRGKATATHTPSWRLVVRTPVSRKITYSQSWHYTSCLEWPWRSNHGPGHKLTKQRVVFYFALVHFLSVRERQRENMCAPLCATCGCQKTKDRSQFSLSTTWVPRIEGRCLTQF